MNNQEARLIYSRPAYFNLRRDWQRFIGNICQNAQCCYNNENEVYIASTVVVIIRLDIRDKYLQHCMLENGGEGPKARA